MQYNPLTGKQRADKSWNHRRNRLVCRLLEENPRMTRLEALREANRRMRAAERKPGGRGK